MQETQNTVNDALGLPLGDALEKRLAALLDEERPLVLASVDLDRFGDVNAEFGLAEGDRVIVETGRCLCAALPENAALYRAGGDQFGVLFEDGTEKESVFLLMERIRAGYVLKLPSGRMQTITVGIASAPDDASAAGELMRKADGAMMRGKRAGGDRVCLAREEKMVTKTSHYAADQLERLTKVAKREGMGEAVLLREALDLLLRRYDG